MKTNTAILKRLLPVAASLSLAACGTMSIPHSDCAKVGDIEPICKFNNPEDIELLPDNKTLLVSQLGALRAATRGSLVFFDTASQAVTPAFPPPADAPSNLSNLSNMADGPERWGATDCPGIPGPEFSPVGISLRQRHDGRWQLAATNQGQRARVEMFELLRREPGYALAWRGCVVTPDSINLDDVALMRDGGFLATHMFDRNAPSLLGFNLGVWKSQLGFDTGHVFEWLPTAPDTFRVLAESRGPFGNGIQLSADDSTVFATYTTGNEVRKLDRKSGKKLGSVEVVRPDNLTWDGKGFLLGASLSGGLLHSMSCMRHPGETCSLPFTIVRINPDNMALEKVLENDGTRMGAATVAQPVGGVLYLGSFTGNRIIKMPHPDAGRK